MLRIFNVHNAHCLYDRGRRAIDAGEVFDLIVQEHQTNSIHSGKNKTFAALNQQIFSIKRQEVEFILKRCRSCAQQKHTLGLYEHL